MLPQEQLTDDPSLPFMRTMMSLYFTNEVTPYAGQDEAKTLPPMEALVLGMMCLTQTYNGQHAKNLLYRKYHMFSARECGIFAEEGKHKPTHGLSDQYSHEEIGELNDIFERDIQLALTRKREKNTPKPRSTRSQRARNKP